MSDALLLDTNFISQWQRGVVSAPAAETLLVSTATLQELYNMQSPDSWKYRYAPPPFKDGPPHFRFQVGLAPFLKEHVGRIRRGQAWLPSRDSFLVNFPSELSGYGFTDQREQAHNLVAQLHTWPAKPFLKVVVSTIFDKAIARIVGDHYEFVVSARIEPIPASPAIAEKAVILLSELVSSGINVKANPRNTFNDMLILATALIYDLELRTNDKLLFRMALKSGMKRTDRSDGFVTLSPVEFDTNKRPPEESKGYVNAPWRATRIGMWDK
ncbi:type II toxin-antitoxin system VapC family toxin [Nocardia salmonicida]|uniref:type II toxin-antitoxin system VapC family toxin n=1 Tax=Nocardia salmonicida TaxID=53431 RepID=UPI000A63FAE3|nr:hypothetical protein [Nocardia salmonicida]